MAPRNTIPPTEKWRGKTATEKGQAKLFAAHEDRGRSEGQSGGMHRCNGCGSELEGGVVLHRSRLYCTLACALDHYDSEWAAARLAAMGRRSRPADPLARTAAFPAAQTA